MGFWQRLFGSQDVVTEAVKEIDPTKTPTRSGFEYGIPEGGINEYTQGMGAATQTDRRSMMQQLYESYLACPWSWACTNAIARTITAGGLMTDWDSDTGEGDQEAPDKPDNVLALERLLKYCNPQEDMRQLLRGIISDLLVFGDAYIEVVWLGGVPVSMYSLDCPSTFPLANEHGEVTGYVQVTEFGQRAEFKPKEIIHISLDSPRSGVFGVSPTQAALLPVTAWLFTAASLKETFRKGNPPNVHVDMPQGLSQPEMNRWTAQYMQRNIGPRNIGFPLMTKGGAAVKELQQNRIEEYLHTLDQKRDEILATYGVPPAEAGVIESGNLGGGTGESQRKTFLVNTCQPIAELVLEKLNFYIVQRGFGIQGWHLKFGEVDMRDSKTIEDIRDIRLRNGAWTLDRYRADIGEPAVDGGDAAVLVDRQNLVLWRDMDAKSKAQIARDLKGSALDPGEPGEKDDPMALEKPEKPEIPPALAAGAGLPGVPPAPPGAPPGPGGRKPPGSRPPRESWQQRYRTRLREALKALPDDFAD
jgi:phage portal protein BeeE